MTRLRRGLVLFLSGALFAAPATAIAQDAPPSSPNVVIDAFRSAVSRQLFTRDGRAEWTGFYLGVAGDVSFGNGDTTFTPLPDATTFPMLITTVPLSPSGASGRVFAGVNLGGDVFIYGFEGGFSFGRPDAFETRSPIRDINGAAIPDSTLLTAQDWKTLATATARVGVAIGPILVFGTGGLAVGRVEYTADADFDEVAFRSSYTTTRVGFTAGAGAEIALTDRVGIRGEFRWINLGEESNIADPTGGTSPFRMRHTWNTKSYDFGVGLHLRF